MDIEFHYHITFILARKAGFNAKDSYVIAYSSQYTDANTFHYFVNFKDGSSYLKAFSSLPKKIQGQARGAYRQFIKTHGNQVYGSSRYIQIHFKKTPLRRKNFDGVF